MSDLAAELREANGTIQALEMLLREKSNTIELLNGGKCPMDEDLWATLKRERDQARKLCLAAVHLLKAATGPSGGPTSWNKTRADWMKQAERLLRA